MTADDIRRRHERAKILGAQAFRGGRKVDACPFRNGSSTSERSSWMGGYEDARAAAKSERGRGR